MSLCLPPRSPSLYLWNLVPLSGSQSLPLGLHLGLSLLPSVCHSLSLCLSLSFPVSPPQAAATCPPSRGSISAKKPPPSQEDILISLFTSHRHRPAAASVSPDLPPVSVNIGDASPCIVWCLITCFPSVTSRFVFTLGMMSSQGAGIQSSNTPGSYRESLVTTFPIILRVAGGVEVCEGEGRLRAHFRDSPRGPTEVVVPRSRGRQRTSGPRRPGVPCGARALARVAGSRSPDRGGRREL